MWVTPIDLRKNNRFGAADLTSGPEYIVQTVEKPLRGFPAEVCSLLRPGIVGRRPTIPTLRSLRCIFCQVHAPQKMILTFFAAAAANLSETFLTSCTPCCPAAGGVFGRGTAGSMFQRVIYGEGTIRVPWLKRVVHCARERVCASPPSLWISLRATFLPPRTRPSFSMSLRTSAHTCGNPHPRRERGQACCR